MTFKISDDYVDVAQRIREFYDRYPEGSLKSATPPEIVAVGGKFFIMYHAQAWRTPDDSAPADGWAWEPVPGPTSFTKDSELQNAETSAWGRAIVACGFETKKIASANEVRNRQADDVNVVPAEPPASAKRQAELDMLLDKIALADPSEKTLDEWREVAAKAARRDFKKERALLTDNELAGLTVKFQEHYGTLKPKPRNAKPKFEAPEGATA